MGGPKVKEILKPELCKIENIELKVAQLSCGFNCTCILTNKGDVYTWGGNLNNTCILGHGLREQPNKKPKKVNGLPPCKFVNMGSHHCAAIDTEGNLWTWGWGNWGNLGHGDRKNISKPKKIESLKNVIQVSCSQPIPGPVKGGGKEGLHTLCCTKDGDCYSFGTSHKGILGN
eukprot:UN28996